MIERARAGVIVTLINHRGHRGNSKRDLFRKGIPLCFCEASLRALIVGKAITVPGGLGPHLALKNRLDKLQGATFDQASSTMRTLSSAR
jgi:hypothetical protein